MRGTRVVYGLQSLVSHPVTRYIIGHPRVFPVRWPLCPPAGGGPYTVVLLTKRISGLSTLRKAPTKIYTSRSHRPTTSLAPRPAQHSTQYIRPPISVHLVCIRSHRTRLPRPDSTPCSKTLEVDLLSQPLLLLHLLQHVLVRQLRARLPRPLQPAKRSL